MFNPFKKIKDPIQISYEEIEDHFLNWRKIFNGKLLPETGCVSDNIYQIIGKFVKNGSLKIPRHAYWPIKPKPTIIEIKAYNDIRIFRRSIGYNSGGLDKYDFPWRSNDSDIEMVTKAKQAAKSMYFFAKELKTAK
jgi:hypothetical protein